MTHFIQTLISGLSLAKIYALIALGYTMVYGIAKMLNFAHGDIIMIGAYAGIVTVNQLGLPPIVAVIVSVVICAGLGMLIEFLAYKPLRQAPPLSVLITAIGVSYLVAEPRLDNLRLPAEGLPQPHRALQLHYRRGHGGRHLRPDPADDGADHGSA